MARQWTCRNCKWKQPRTASRKCAMCGRLTKPKPRVAKNAETLRDDSYERYVHLNAVIHGVGDECANCGRPRDERKLDRDHDHRTGRARGLLCGGNSGCNKRLGNRTLEQLRGDLAYLERVEAWYARQEEAA